MALSVFSVMVTPIDEEASKFPVKHIMVKKP